MRLILGTLSSVQRERDVCILGKWSVFINVWKYLPHHHMPLWILLLTYMRGESTQRSTAENQRWDKERKEGNVTTQLEDPELLRSISSLEFPVLWFNKPSSKLLNLFLGKFIYTRLTWISSIFYPKPLNTNRLHCSAKNKAAYAAMQAQVFPTVEHLRCRGSKKTSFTKEEKWNSEFNMMSIVSDSGNSCGSKSITKLYITYFLNYLRKGIPLTLNYTN